MYLTHNYLCLKHPVQDLKFAALRPNQNRYKGAYEEVCFRVNHEFSAAAAVPGLNCADGSSLLTPLPSTFARRFSLGRTSEARSSPCITTYQGDTTDNI